MLENPPVTIIMGSQSDYSLVRDSIHYMLDQLEIKYETRVYSAHRTPDELQRYVKHLETAGGYRVIIAVAGMSAALPGSIAALTHLPVIGVPVDCGLGGIDAILSMVRMPGGVPVATVSTGSAGGKNAAILAARILSLSDMGIERRLKELMDNMRRDTLEANDHIQELGNG